MVFQLYSSQFSQATRSVALWVMAAGLMLVGIGFLTYLLRDILVFFIAALFVFAGIVVISWGVRLFFAALRIGRSHSADNAETYRENVTIRIEDHSL